MPDPISTRRDRAIDQELELLRRYHTDGDFQARGEVIERAMPLVHHVARRYADRGEPYDDLVQAGCVGLVKAVDRFDPERGARFASFAIPNIAGEIRRHFRDRGWAVRVPRDIQEREAALTSAAEELTERLQRTPSAKELAEATGLTVAQVLEAIAAGRNYDALSLDRQVDDESSVHDRLGVDDDGFEQVERRLVLKLGMQALQERERRIVHLRFYGGLTQSEIAERVGISQMHVSRLLRRAISTMHERVETDAEAASGPAR